MRAAKLRSITFRASVPLPVSGPIEISKLANILFTTELARRLQGTGVTVDRVAPGSHRTGFGKNNPGFFMKIMQLIVLWLPVPPKKVRRRPLSWAILPHPSKASPENTSSIARPPNRPHRLPMRPSPETLGCQCRAGPPGGLVGAGRGTKVPLFGIYRAPTHRAPPVICPTPGPPHFRRKWGGACPDVIGRDARRAGRAGQPGPGGYGGEARLDLRVFPAMEVCLFTSSFCGFFTGVDRLRKKPYTMPNVHELYVSLINHSWVASGMRKE